MARPKREVAEDDKLGPVTMTLNKKHTTTLDNLRDQLGVGSRSAAAAKLLVAVENMVRKGDLTIEQIALASLRSAS